MVLTEDNCTLSDPDKLEWTIKPTAVAKPLRKDPSKAPVNILYNYTTFLLWL